MNKKKPLKSGFFFYYIGIEKLFTTKAPRH